MNQQQTQAEANAFGDGKDDPRWVVEFTTGGRRNRRTGGVVVGARSASGARRAALAEMERRGEDWAKSAAASVRLAKAQELGCVGVEA